MLTNFLAAPIVPGEIRRTSTLYAIATVLVALAMFAAAVGSGDPGTDPADRLPGWVDTAANVVSAVLGVLVLLPATRGGAAAAAAATMGLAMGANYLVDGPDFFLRALPFNVVTMVLGVLIARRSLLAARARATASTRSAVRG